MSYERIPFPAGQAPAQLYQHQLALTKELKRIFLTVTGDADATISDLQSDITALRADVDILLAGSGGGGGGLTPQEQFELSLVTATSDVLGSFSSLYERAKSRWEYDADAAIRAALEANKANVGLKTEIRVRADEDLALAEQITTVEAVLGVTNAQVVTLTQAVADGDSALSTQVTALQSQVAGNVAEVQVLTASVNGIETRFAVTLNNNGEVTGYIQLDGSVTGSVFTVAADKFQVSQIGVTGGAARPVFAIGSVNGVTRLVLRGEMFADGTITARHIAADSITADKISVGAITAISGNFGNAAVQGRLTGGPNGKLVLDFTNGRIRALA